MGANPHEGQTQGLLRLNLKSSQVSAEPSKTDLHEYRCLQRLWYNQVS